MAVALLLGGIRFARRLALIARHELPAVDYNSRCRISSRSASLSSNGII